MVKETRLYELLQISTDADYQDIRKAYKALALKYHPDKQTVKSTEETERLTNIFKDITEAYNILSDKNKRYLYDNYGEEVAKNPQDATTAFSANNHHYDHDLNNRYGNANHYYNRRSQQSRQHTEFNDSMNFPFSQHSTDMFEQIFSGFPDTTFMNTFNTPFNATRSDDYPNHSYGRPVYRDGSNPQKKGRDIMDNIPCNLIDYYNGKDIKLRLSKRVKCPKCKGRGGLKVYTCNDCCGSGIIINETRTGLMYQRVQATCNRCHGSGEFIPAKYVCDECGGNKLVDTKVIFEFRSPRGVSAGYKIIIPNAADEGIDLIPGDVILTLQDSKIDDNTKFKRFGDYLLTTISIPLSVALCGGYITFTHINNEEVKIEIPRGSIKSGNQLKVLKGFGMPIAQETPSSRRSKDGQSNKRDKKKHRNRNGKDKNYKGKEDVNYGKSNRNDDVNNGTNIINMNDSTLNKSSSNSEEDKEKIKFGDLIIKFEIEFPDVNLFTNEQVQLLNNVLTGQMVPTSFGTVSDSSSDDISSMEESNPTSLNMTPRFESSASSMSSKFKYGTSTSGSDRSLNVSKAVPMTVPKEHGYANGVDINDFTKSGAGVELSKPKEGSESTDLNDSGSDNMGDKIVYLEDITNVEKVGLSLLDFPETSNKGSTMSNSNGYHPTSAEDTVHTANVMDSSIPGIPNTKRFKSRM